MTGFGSARTEADNLTVLVEIKSVNHRYIFPRRSSMPEAKREITGEESNQGRFLKILIWPISVVYKRSSTGDPAGALYEASARTIVPSKLGSA
jgi:hypothetical protein